MVDTGDLKSPDRKVVSVQVRSRAPYIASPPKLSDTNILALFLKNREVTTLFSYFCFIFIRLTGVNDGRIYNQSWKFIFLMVAMVLICLFQMGLIYVRGETINSARTLSVTILGFLGLIAALTVSKEANATSIFGLLGALGGFVLGKIYFEDKSK